MLPSVFDDRRRLKRPTIPFTRLPDSVWHQIFLALPDARARVRASLLCKDALRLRQERGDDWGCGEAELRAREHALCAALTPQAARPVGIKAALAALRHNFPPHRPGIYSLDLRSPQLTPAAMAQLLTALTGAHPTLQMLDLRTPRAYRPEGPTLRFFAAIPRNLIELRLRHSWPYFAQIVQQLQEMSALRSLTLDICAAQPLKFFLPQLQELTLNGIGRWRDGVAGRETIDLQHSVPNLRALKLSGCAVEVCPFTLSGLTSLHVDNQREAELKAMFVEAAPADGLRSLRWRSSSARKEVLALAAPYVERATLQRVYANQFLAQHLDLDRLVSLRMEDCGLVAADLHMLPLKNLHDLEIPNNPLGPGAGKIDFRGIKTLNIAGCGLDDQACTMRLGVKSFLAIGNNPRLTAAGLMRLDLRHVDRLDSNPRLLSLIGAAALAAHPDWLLGHLRHDLWRSAQLTYPVYVPVSWRTPVVWTLVHLCGYEAIPTQAIAQRLLDRCVQDLGAHIGAVASAVEQPLARASTPITDREQRAAAALLEMMAEGGAPALAGLQFDPLQTCPRTFGGLEMQLSMVDMAILSGRDLLVMRLLQYGPYKWPDSVNPRHTILPFLRRAEFFAALRGGEVPWAPTLAARLRAFGGPAMPTTSVMVPNMLALPSAAVTP